MPQYQPKILIKDGRPQDTEGYEGEIRFGKMNGTLHQFIRMNNNWHSIPFSRSLGATTEEVVKSTTFQNKVVQNTEMSSLVVDNLTVTQNISDSAGNSSTSAAIITHHGQHNQAHNDYLRNNASDTMAGGLTVLGTNANYTFKATTPSGIEKLWIGNDDHGNGYTGIGIGVVGGDIAQDSDNSNKYARLQIKTTDVGVQDFIFHDSGDFKVEKIEVSGNISLDGAGSKIQFDGTDMFYKAGDYLFINNISSIHTGQGHNHVYSPQTPTSPDNCITFGGGSLLSGDKQLVDGVVIGVDSPMTASITAGSIGDTQLTFNTGQHLTKTNATSGFDIVQFEDLYLVSTQTVAPLHIKTGNENKIKLTDTSSGDTVTYIGSTNAGDINLVPVATKDVVIPTDSGFRSSGYTSGWGGDGFSIYETAVNNKYGLELENLNVRGTMSVHELLINQVRATNGGLVIGASVELSSSTQSSGAVGVFECSPTTEAHPFVDNDLLLCQFWDGSTTQKYYIKVTDHDAPSLSPQYKFTGEFYQANNTSGTWADIPAGKTLVRIGNTDVADKQGGVYLTADDTGAPYIRIWDNVDGFDDWGSSSEKVRIGNLTGISGASGYGLWGEDVYLTGEINATTGYIGNESSGWAIDANGITNTTGGASNRIGIGTDGYNNSNQKFWVDGSGRFSLGDKLVWDGTNLTVKGTLLMPDGSDFVGTQGPQGDTGPQGPSGDDGIGFVWTYEDRDQENCTFVGHWRLYTDVDGGDGNRTDSYSDTVMIRFCHNQVGTANKKDDAATLSTGDRIKLVCLEASGGSAVGDFGLYELTAAPLIYSSLNGDSEGNIFELRVNHIDSLGKPGDEQDPPNVWSKHNVVIHVGQGGETGPQGPPGATGANNQDFAYLDDNVASLVATAADQTIASGLAINSEIMGYHGQIAQGSDAAAVTSDFITAITNTGEFFLKGTDATTSSLSFNPALNGGQGLLTATGAINATGGNVFDMWNGPVLNAGSTCTSIDHWNISGETADDATASSEQIDDGQTGTHCLRFTKDSGVSTAGDKISFLSNSMSINPDKTYKASVWVRRTTGGTNRRPAYLLINFMKQDGTVISDSAGNHGFTAEELDKWQDSTLDDGTPTKTGTGGYWYFGLVNDIPTYSWTKYEIEFGGDGGQTPIPQDATQFQIGGLAVRAADGTTNYNTTTQEFQDFKVIEQELASGTTIHGGGITMDGGGVVKGGQSTYDTGAGFFLGYTGNKYKFSIGDGANKSLKWDGTDLLLTGDINATGGLISGQVKFGPNDTDATMKMGARLGPDSSTTWTVTGIGDYGAGDYAGLGHVVVQFLPGGGSSSNPAEHGVITGDLVTIAGSSYYNGDWYVQVIDDQDIILLGATLQGNTTGGATLTNWRKHGIYVDNDNYWYNDGSFSLGDGKLIGTSSGDVTISASAINFTVTAADLDGLEDDIVSSINLSSDGVRIDGDNIKITGKTTFEHDGNRTLFHWDGSAGGRFGYSTWNLDHKSDHSSNSFQYISADWAEQGGSVAKLNTITNGSGTISFTFKHDGDNVLSSMYSTEVNEVSGLIPYNPNGQKYILEAKLYCTTSSSFSQTGESICYAGIQFYDIGGQPINRNGGIGDSHPHYFLIAGDVINKETYSEETYGVVDTDKIPVPVYSAHFMEATNSTGVGTGWGIRGHIPEFRPGFGSRTPAYMKIFFTAGYNDKQVEVYIDWVTLKEKNNGISSTIIDGNSIRTGSINADNINTGLLTADSGFINDLTTNAFATTSGGVEIEGSHIKTGTIDGHRIDAQNIFSQNIEASGALKGTMLIAAGCSSRGANDNFTAGCQDGVAGHTTAAACRAAHDGKWGYFSGTSYPFVQTGHQRWDNPYPNNQSNFPNYAQGGPLAIPDCAIGCKVIYFLAYDFAGAGAVDLNSARLRFDDNPPVGGTDYGSYWNADTQSISHSFSSFDSTTDSAGFHSHSFSVTQGEFGGSLLSGSFFPDVQAGERANPGTLYFIPYVHSSGDNIIAVNFSLTILVINMP